jgi:hypothetical protein
MDMDQAAVFLGGSILTMLGFVVVVAGVVAINNIFSRFWKPVRIFTPDSWTGINPPNQFANQEQLDKKEPT